jgi:hypothetical protein
MNNKLKNAGYTLTGVVMFGLLLRMLYMIYDGNGGEIVTSMKGLKYTPIAFVIFALSIPLFIFLARALTWFLERDRRAFKRYIKARLKRRKKRTKSNVKSHLESRNFTGV